MTTHDHVILVDKHDAVLGTKEKLAAHQEGLLHRAFSVFVFDPEGLCLLQRRAATKYHSPGLWSNACCSHPLPNEDTEKAVHRRLREELGIACAVEKAYEVCYDLDVGEGLREAEYNHTFVGLYDSAKSIPLNTDEVSALRWERVETIQEELRSQPDIYTTWFHLLFPKVAVFRDAQT